MKRSLWINRSRYPRWLHWVYAYIHADSWCVCHACGKKKGGHEPTVTWWINPCYGIKVCMNCAAAAARNNEIKKHIKPKYCTPDGVYHWE